MSTEPAPKTDTSYACPSCGQETPVIISNRLLTCKYCRTQFAMRKERDNGNGTEAVRLARYTPSPYGIVGNRAFSPEGPIWFYSNIYIAPEGSGNAPKV